MLSIVEKVLLKQVLLKQVLSRSFAQTSSTQKILQSSKDCPIYGEAAAGING